MCVDLHLFRKFRSQTPPDSSNEHAAVKIALTIGLCIVVVVIGRRLDLRSLVRSRAADHRKKSKQVSK